MAYKLGIIGFGGMAGGYHVDTVLREDIPFEPVAAYDIDPNRLAYAKQRGLAAYDKLEDFFAHYFGEAGDTMKDLLDEQREWMVHLYTDLGLEGYIWDNLLDDRYWSFNQLERYLGRIDLAYEAIEPLRETDPTRYAELYDRILLESIQFRYLQLQLYATEFSATELREARMEFRADFERLQLTSQSEGGDIHDLWNQWELD